MKQFKWKGIPVNIPDKKIAASKTGLLHQPYRLLTEYLKRDKE